jgi:hypothetical protein
MDVQKKHPKPSKSVEFSPTSTSPLAKKHPKPSESEEFSLTSKSVEFPLEPLHTGTSTSEIKHPKPSKSVEYTPLEPLHTGTSTSITRVRHGSTTTFITKSDCLELSGYKEKQKYYKEFLIGSSVHSPYVVEFVEFKRCEKYYLF